MVESAGYLISFGRTPNEDMTNLLSHKGTESFQEQLLPFSAQECFFYVKKVAGDIRQSYFLLVCDIFLYMADAVKPL